MVRQSSQVGVGPPAPGDEPMYEMYEISEPANVDLRLILDTGRTRLRLALVLAVGYVICSIGVVLGGIIGRFGEGLVWTNVAGLAALTASAVYHYFRQLK